MTGREHIVGLAELQVARGAGRLITLGLGSCVAIVLYDETTRTGGLAHVLLPSKIMSRIRDAPGRYPETAVPVLLDAMADLGAGRGQIKARLIGGASMFASLSPAGVLPMGERNVVASREALATAGIDIVAERVGSDFGRSVSVDLATGKVEVSSVRHGVEYC